jgi:hypothetical protein
MLVIILLSYTVDNTQHMQVLIQMTGNLQFAANDFPAYHVT